MIRNEYRYRFFSIGAMGIALFQVLLAGCSGGSSSGGTGRFFPVGTGGDGGQKPVALALADYDRDGWLDVAVLNQGTSSITILRGTTW